MKRTQYTRRSFLKAVALGAGAGALFSCATPPWVSRARRPFSFAQVCDPQLGMGGYEHDVNSFRQAVRQINALKPDFVVICGDLVNAADAKTIADFNEIRAGLTVPSYCAPGNHDVGNAPSAESLRAYRSAVGRDYFSFVHKGRTFLVVNTSLWKSPLAGESEKHDAWLNMTLQAARDRRQQVFVIGHHPLFIKDLAEPDDYMNVPAARRMALLSLFERTGVVAVVGGHAHRLVVNDHRGIQLVNGGSTSKNFDRRPLGFRLWQVGDAQPFQHELVPLDGF